MPRAKGIPAYSLHKPTGRARVRIDGKGHYLDPHGSEVSKRKYEQICPSGAQDDRRARSG